jgi:hypothetical protein
MAHSELQILHQALAFHKWTDAGILRRKAERPFERGGASRIFRIWPLTSRESLQPSMGRRWRHYCLQATEVELVDGTEYPEFRNT